MKSSPFFSGRAVPALLAVLMLPGAAMAQASFATPELAADAFIEAVATSSAAGHERVLGKEWRKLLPPEGIDPDDRRAFLDKAKEVRAVVVTDGRGELVVGADKWPFPIPLMRTSNGQWRFDPRGGREAIRERVIGANERSAMQAALAYIDAQRDYAAADRNGDGVREYARRLLSQTGKRDGLIWSPKLGDDSPLGEGYLPAKPGTGYHGYRFRILEAQGARGPGGARSYLIGNRLLSGFALIAWPVTYGQTGVMSFIVNHDGILYERDLGPETQTTASAIKRYDPDDQWKRATP
jgi:hypothetical protein